MPEGHNDLQNRYDYHEYRKSLLLQFVCLKHDDINHKQKVPTPVALILDSLILQISLSRDSLRLIVLEITYFMQKGNFE